MMLDSIIEDKFPSDFLVKSPLLQWTLNIHESCLYPDRKDNVHFALFFRFSPSPSYLKFMVSSPDSVFLLCVVYSIALE